VWIELKAVSGDWQPRVDDAIEVVWIDLAQVRAGVALRTIVGRVTGLEPAQLRFAHGLHGKPYLAGSDVFFNLSHTKKWAVVAWSRGREVGVDIEQWKRGGLNPQRLASRWLHDEEQVALAASPEQNRLGLFLRLWTAREAYLKGIGIGLGAGRESFNGAPLLEGVQALAWRGWTVRPLPGPEGLCGAVAARGSGWGIRLATLDSAVGGVCC